MPMWLQAALAQLDPETLLATAQAAAREQVKTEVMKQEKVVRDSVTQSVQAQVLEGVLAQSGLNRRLRITARPSLPGR